MTTQLGGYEDNADSKNSVRREVTVSSSGDKAYLDVKTVNVTSDNRQSGTITVTSGSGSVALTNVNIKSDFIGVSAPNASDTFTVNVIDTDTGVILTTFEARESDDGVARSKSFGLSLYNITISITSASNDGSYTYLVMG